MYNMCKKLWKLTKIITKVGYVVTLLDGSTMQNPLGPQDYFMRTFFILLMIDSSNAKYFWEFYDVIFQTWCNIRKLNIV